MLRLPPFTPRLSASNTIPVETMIFRGNEVAVWRTAVPYMRAIAATRFPDGCLGAMQVAVRHDGSAWVHMPVFVGGEHICDILPVVPDEAGNPGGYFTFPPEAYENAPLWIPE